MDVARGVNNLKHPGPFPRNAIESRNVHVLSAMLGPAWRGIVPQRGKTAHRSTVDCGHNAQFSWNCERDQPDMAPLYELAKKLGLLSDRVKPRYADLGVLQFQTDSTATELTTEEVLGG